MYVTISAVGNRIFWNRVSVFGSVKELSSPVMVPVSQVAGSGPRTEYPFLIGTRIQWIGYPKPSEQHSISTWIWVLPIFNDLICGNRVLELADFYIQNRVSGFYDFSKMQFYQH